MCLPAFASQRSTSERIARELQPAVVACLGAGALNDIPFDYLIGSQATVHLVDWMQGSIDFGLTRSIIEQPAAERTRRKAATPLLDTLREELMTNQVLGHCGEIERILAPGGHCFMAFEMFHRDHGGERWFLVHEMHRVLEVIADRFAFDFNRDP